VASNALEARIDFQHDAKSPPATQCGGCLRSAGAVGVLIQPLRILAVMAPLLTFPTSVSAQSPALERSSSGCADTEMAAAEVPDGCKVDLRGAIHRKSRAWNSFRSPFRRSLRLRATRSPVSANPGSGRSTIKLMLIGAAIGGGAGAVGGTAYGQATKDGAEVVAIPIFAGVGAVVRMHGRTHE
jgi:hypothetical protein